MSRPIPRAPSQWRRCFAGSRMFSVSANRLRIDKISLSADEAIRNVRSGSTILVGGFGFSGVPATLINSLRDRMDLGNFTVVSNNAGQLLETGQIAKMIASYVGENKLLESQYLKGKLELELVPQGTIAERCAAGAAGVPAFYTPAAYGTIVQTGELPLRYNPDKTVAAMSKPRETRVFNGKNFVMEESILGDVALVKVNKADRLGNCTFRKAQNNFNEIMGKNAKYTVVEADEIVQVGDILPENVHLQGIYVDKVVLSTQAKKIEKLTLAKTPDEVVETASGPRDGGKRERIIRRAAKELKDGMYVNLGIGIPLATPGLVPEGVEVILQSENGILGMGRYPEKGQEDPDLINPGKETVTLNPGASVFRSHESFGMIRAGKIDVTMLGALQVSEHGDLANFMLPGKVKGIGGAMDLVANPEKTRVIVTMEHVDRKGNPKILENCTFPLTGQRCVSRIITDIAVFDCTPKGLVLRELVPRISVEKLKLMTGAGFQIAEDFKDYEA
ncbi:hypothetical protein FE257_006720 [Aspergillus nanangensis]|uniref:Succinyl-CoA:3-ketoacid-coenzyme A transferase n=1 Tax=Aspergillus nanangensis TaxID=2582783 RepID=A0AAD4CP13_ASPNN|nr:hypothetical protein FE257_006720 [Aspergillus nanangensis]